MADSPGVAKVPFAPLATIFPTLLIIYDVGYKPQCLLYPRVDSSAICIGRPMSCMPGYFEVINSHTVGSLTIPRANFTWV